MPHAFSSGALAALNPMQIKLTAIETDDDGMKPEKLAATLDNWDLAKVCAGASE